MALFGFTRLSATPSSPTSTLAIQVEDTSEWPTAPFALLIRRANVRPRGSTAEAVEVQSYTGGGSVTLSQRALNISGTQTIALALRKGDECYPLDSDAASLYLYVVGGSGQYAATRAGLQLAITAASGAGGGHVLIVQDITFDTTSVTFPVAGNVELSSLPGVVLSAPASGAVAGGMLALAGSATATSVVAANIARLARSFTHNQTAGLTFARGDYVMVTDSTAQTHISRVVAVSGAAPQTVVLADPFSVAFTTANSATCARQTPSPGIYVHDLTFDNNGNTDAVRAIIGFRLVADRWENLTFTGFKGSGLTGGDSANAFSLAYTYHSTRRNIDVYDSGTLGLAAISHSNNTRSLDENHRIVDCGFGFNQLFANHFTMRSIEVAYSGNGLGFGGSVANQPVVDGVVDDCWTHHITASRTGYRVRGGTNNVIFSNGGAYACSAQGLVIIGTATTTENNLKFTDMHFVGNGIDTGVDIDVATTALAPFAIEFRNVTYGTRSDTGVGTLWNNAVGPVNSGGAIVNSITRTAIFSRALYPGQLTLYNGLEGVISGAIINDAGADRTLILELQYGSSAQIVKTTVPIPDPGASAFRPFEINFSIRNVTVTNSQGLRMLVLLGVTTAGQTGDGSLATAAPIGFQPLYATGTVDSTAAQTLAVYATCSANDFTVAGSQAFLRQVG